MSCDKCRKRSCRARANHLRELFFAMGRKDAPPVTCADFEPAYYHGLEDVYA